MFSFIKSYCGHGASFTAIESLRESSNRLSTFEHFTESYGEAPFLMAYMSIPAVNNKCNRFCIGVCMITVSRDHLEEASDKGVWAD